MIVWSEHYLVFGRNGPAGADGVKLLISNLESFVFTFVLFIYKYVINKPYNFLINYMKQSFHLSTHPYN